MAIVALKKMTLCGLLKDKKQVLRQMQLCGGAHLIPLVSLTPSTYGRDKKQTELTKDALKYLNQCANKRHQVHHADNFNSRDIVKQVLQVKSEWHRLSAEREFLSERIADIKPWGDFQLAHLGALKLWFYIVPKRLMKKVDASLTYQVVAKDNIHCYVVVISAQEPAESAMPVARTHTGQIPLSQLQKQLQELELSLDDLQAERESLTRWITLLSLNLYSTEDHDALKSARQMTLDKDSVFIVQAWIAHTLIEKYQDFAQQHQLAILINEPMPTDTPPTLLENNDKLAGGEQLTGFYQTPAYRDWDPSPVVFFSFALFFAMILSDAGYAAIFVGILAIKWRALGRTEKGLRMRSLLLVTLMFSLFWGALCGSYFGYSPTSGAFLNRVKVMDLQDFDSMMTFSISVGVVHICLANLIKAWQWRRHNRALAPVGWCLAVIGGYTLWRIANNADDTLLWFAWGGIAVATLFILFFSSDQPMTKFSDVFIRLWTGLQQLSAISKLFGDILSYMRLFALGLASASLAMTFNQLAIQVNQSVPGGGLLLSLMILLFGHSLNLLLCLMSGVVHGLRLNFIEFYNWSVSDEGYPFKEFAKRGAS